MKKITSVLFLLNFLFSVYLSAQCPTAAFTVNPDSVCAGQNLNLTNTSIGAPPLQYTWDFCPGDLNTTPTGINIGNPGGLVAGQQIKIVNDNGNYHVFVVKYTGQILRVDFGSSLENSVLGTFAYTGFGGDFLYGIDVFKEGSNWYAFVMTDQSNHHLFRIDLGSTISNNIYSNTDLGDVGMSGAAFLKITKDCNNYFVFVTTVSGNNLYRLNFGNSLSNTIADTTTMTNALFNSSYGVDFGYDCASTNYVGFVSSYNGTIAVVNFGDSLSGTWSISHTLNTNGNAIGLNLLRDGTNWHLLYALYGGSALQPALQQLKLGSNLFNQTPPFGFSDTIGQISVPTGVSFIKDSSRFYGFVTNSSGTSANTLTRIKFESACAANISSSAAFAPSNISYSSPGWQHIDLEAIENNCRTNFDYDSVFVNPFPSVTFGFSTACVGQSVSFYDSTTVAPGNITSWLWNFGDLNFSSLQNPQHTYAAAGTYIVTLTATSSAGCSSVDTDTVIVHNVPTASFSYAAACAGVATNFTDGSSISLPDIITAWHWDFGNGDTSVLQNPAYSYPTGGTYTVTLTAYSNQGCGGVSSQTVVIPYSPVCSFAVTNTCVGLPTLFSNTTTSVSPVTSTQWDFGDLSSFNGANPPPHLYPAVVDSYLVSLVTVSQNGCSDTLDTTIYVSNIPSAGFTFSPPAACELNNVTFTDASTGTVSSWLWDFGDSSPVSTAQNPVHQFSAFGSYTVMLIAYSPTSCPDTFTQVVNVAQSPTANFNYSTTCFGDSTFFSDLSTFPTGNPITAWLWNFGDTASANNTSANAAPAHLFSNYGTFIVTLRVTTTIGCIDTFALNVIVKPRPSASFTVDDTLCAGVPVAFINTSSPPPSASIVAYQWNFGDSNFATTQNTSHTYLSSGVYTVILTDSASNGCTSTTSQVVIINQSASPNFSAVNLCLGQTTNFFNATLPLGISSYQWAFGDNSYSIQTTPNHQYAYAQNWPVSLTATTANGCSRTYYDTITIHPQPTAWFRNPSACVNTAYQLLDSSYVTPTGTITNWLWTFPDSSTSITQSPYYMFNDTIVHNITLIATSGAGCKDTVTRAVKVYPLPTAVFSPDNTYGDIPFTVNFQNSSTGASFYSWDFGDTAGTSSAFNPTYVYTNYSSYPVTLIVTTTHGCADTTVKYIFTLHPLLDLAVTSVTPLPGNNTLSVRARFSNLGTVAINNFKISAYIENGTLVFENYGGPSLPPSAQTDYTLAVTFETSPVNPPSFVCVEAMEPNNQADDIPANNEKCSTLSNSYVVVNPYPNPVSDVVTFEVIAPGRNTLRAECFDATGKMLGVLYDGSIIQGLNRFIYDLGAKAEGVYFFRFDFGSKIIVVPTAHIKPKK